MKRNILAGNREHASYMEIHNKLLFHDKTMLSKASGLILMLLQEFHDSEIGGHSEVFKTYQQASQEFY